jgi:hypothetical protein
MRSSVTFQVVLSDDVKSIVDFILNKDIDVLLYTYKSFFEGLFSPSFTKISD